MSSKIRVLIVDDSAVVRQNLAEIIKSDSMLEVMGTASDPFVAAKKIKQEVPDVITLDIEMPRMDGLTFLRKIMNQYPIPVVIISSVSGEGTKTAFKAFEYGAVEIITKPFLSTKEFIQESKIRICEAIKGAAQAKVKRKNVTPQDIKIIPKYSADVILPPIHNTSIIKTTEIVVVVGASTGGTEAITVLLQNLPVDFPGIVVVQHMPEQFTASFANRLNDICNISVKEAENGDPIMKGRALIAPGNFHTMVKQSSSRYYVEVTQGPFVNRHRPSVDVLFRSAARYAGSNSVGILLTGMGDDGAKGLLELKNSGAKTIAQDEESCIVFGMPKEAIKLNAADKVLPLTKIPGYLLSIFNQKN